MKSGIQKPTKTEFIGGERGSRSGSIIIIPAKREGRRIIQPEKIYARRRYLDPKTGKLREKKRLVESRTEAKAKLLELAGEIKRDKVEVIRPAQKTFADLADFYQKEYLQPPKKTGEGLKSWEKLKHPLNVLRNEFGDEPLAAIDYLRIADFRKRFLDTKTRHKTERSLASVNRALELLRRMLNIARHRKWFAGDPFREGDPLIRKSRETKRMRILSHAEERLLLAAVKAAGAGVQANARHSRNLYRALIFAIDTAARAGEQFGTRVSDVNLDQGYIRVRGKTMLPTEERIVPITTRLASELRKLKPLKRSLRRAQKPSPSERGLGEGRAAIRDELIFDFTRPKRSFASALEKAGIANFRWHDLRHTGTMRMLEAGVDPATVMKVTGHTNWSTFMRYVNMNPELVRGVAAKIDTARSRKRA